MRVAAIDRGERDLLHIVDALGSRGRLANFLDGGDQQTNEDGNNGDYDQKLDKREGTLSAKERKRWH
jgi:hypothetical protein